MLYVRRHNMFLTPWPHCCLIISVWIVPCIYPTSQFMHSPLQLPGKHCMPWPAPQHDRNIQLSLSHCLSVCFHSCEEITTGVQLCRKLHVFACVNVFSMHTQWCPIPLRPEKKASIIFFTITTFISICLPQMSRHAMVRLHTKRVPGEKRKQKQGSWDNCLEISYQKRAQSCQHQVTLGSRHADGDFFQRW